MANLHAFKTIPTRKPPRSRFDLGTEALFTLSEGALFPFYCEEALPFDTWEISLGSSVRNLQTQVHPVMQDAYIDFYWFFVPSRILWKHWEQFMGVAEPSAFTNPTEYALPVIGDYGGVVAKGSVAEGLGFPSGLGFDEFGIGGRINLLTLAGYCSIWNNWFRDENLQESNPLPEIVYNMASGADLDAGDRQYLDPIISHTAGYNQFSSVNKYKDLFTSCLPSPQKGPEVSMLQGFANVVGDQTQNTAAKMHPTSNIYFATGTDASPLAFRGNLVTGVTGQLYDVASDDVGSGPSVSRTNLVADLSTVSGNTIDTLRKSIAMQVFFEQLARGGSRYCELLRNQFGVAPIDGVLQRPELIGYQHVRLDQQQVATTAGQGTAGTESKTATGTLGGYSVTSKYQNQTFKSFNEYGWIYGLAAIRVKHKYWQGIPKKLTKSQRFDFFIPAFDRIGAVPVPISEIFGYDGEFDQTLGFQDAHYEYRHTPDRIMGDVVPDGFSADLAAWSYADTFNTSPTLSSSFIKENRNNIQQTLAGTTSVAQYLVSLDCDIQVTRPMSLDSNPSSLGM